MQAAKDRSSRTDPLSTAGNLRAWAAVVALLVLTTLALLDRQIITLMVDPVRSRFGVGDAEMGLLQGPAFAIAFLLGSMPMGWIIDNFSARRAIFLAVLLWSAATIACGLAGSFAALVAARAIVGLGQAALAPAGWSIVATLFPPQRLSFAIGVLSTGTQVGAATSFVLAGLILAEAEALGTAIPILAAVQPWQIVFFAAGAPGLALAFLAFAAPPRRRPAEGACTAAPRAFAAFLKANRAFLLCHVLGFSCLSALVYGTATWTPTLLLRSFGLSAREVGLILALIAVPVGASGLLFNGWAADRAFAAGRDDAHLRHFAAVAVIIAVVGGIGFLTIADLWPLILCLAATSFLQPFAGVAAAALQIATPVELRGRASALFIMIYQAFGMIAGPSAVALTASVIAVERPLATAIALAFAVFGAAAAACLWIGRGHAARAIGRLRPGDAASPATRSPTSTDRRSVSE